MFLIAGFIVSCADNEEKTAVKNKEEKSAENPLSEKEQIIRQVENSLSIDATEDYTIEIIPKHIDSDTIEDALILVNRKEFAFKKAKRTNTESFFESTGYSGQYNFVFVKLGARKKLLSTIPVGSNANYKLTHEFVELTSKAHKDFYVEYRVRNSLYRNYYTVRNNILHLTLSCPVFDEIGEENPRVYDIQHVESPVRLAKDIVLYEGKMVDYDPKNIENVNFYQPKEIVKNGPLYVYFIFDDKRMKYVTPMKAPTEE